MKNVKKSTLILAVIAIAALIFGGVELGNKNSLNDQLTAATDKIAKIGESLGIENIGDLDVDKLVETVNGKIDELKNTVSDTIEDGKEALEEKVDELQGDAQELLDNVNDAGDELVNNVTDAVNDATGDVNE